jgi:uncharacterized protein YjdB
VKKLIVWALIFSFLFGITGCSKSIELESIVLDPEELVLEISQSRQLNISFVPESAEATDITWSSSDGSVASVD